MRGETVTILRPGESTRDSHGNDVPGPDVEIPIPGAIVWPTGSGEQIQGQDQVDERRSVSFPYGTTVYASDKARIRGSVYQVDGRAESWASPFTGTKAGVLVNFERITG